MRYSLSAVGAAAIVVLGGVVIASLARSGDRPAQSPAASIAVFLGVPSATLSSTATSSTGAAPETPTSTATQLPSYGLLPSTSLDPSLALANVALPGSPEIDLFQRVGDDIAVLGWRPGESDLATRHALRGAAGGLTDRQTVQTTLSPDGSLLLVHAHPSTNGDPDTFRLFSLEGTGGREIWHSDSLGSVLAAAFVPTGQLVITSSAPLRRSGDRGWTIVDVSADRPIVHDIDLPPIPAPAPSATVDFRTQIFNYSPLGISADGHWIYALSAHATEPAYRPAYRISIATGHAAPIHALPTVGPSPVVSPSVDRSGRLLLFGPRSTVGHGLIEAWSAGASKPDFETDLGNVWFAAWTADGGVITAAYDRLPGPFRFRVLSLTATGKVATTFLTGSGTDAALVGVQNGFAAAYIAQAGSGRRTLVVIRLSDGTTSGVDVADPHGGILWVPGLRP